MKNFVIIITLIILSSSLNAQDLHSHANAASISNESNSVNGWTGNGVLASDTFDVHNGTYAMRLEYNSVSSRIAEYVFPAVVGNDYTITIWAKRGTQSTDPAFAAWVGMSIPVTTIDSEEWTPYVFNVTATTTAPRIRIFGGSPNATVGDIVYFDSVSIIEGNADTEAPSAVTDLAASNTTMSTTDLTWTASTDNVGVTDYEVFQDGVSLGLTGGITSFNVTNLSPSTSYAFTIFAQDAAGNISTVSNTANVTTLTDTEAPTAITDLLASGTTSTTTDLSWTGSNDNVGVTDYEVFQDGVSIGLTGGLLSFNVTGLSPSTSYAFTVVAQDAAGNVSTMSNTANVTTLAPPDTEAPTAVADLAASNTTMSTTNLTWTASTDNIGVSDYEVFQDGISIGQTGGLTSFNATGLSPNTGYAFTVLARDAAGNSSAISNTVSVTTEGLDTEAPSPVSDLTSSGTTSNSTILSWTEPFDNVGVTDYEVFQGFTSIGTTGGVTSLNVSGLLSSTAYAFTVYAIDASGNISLVSNTSIVQTQAPDCPLPPCGPPPPPAGVTDLNASNISQVSLDLSWSHVDFSEHVTTYDVLQDGISIGQTTELTFFSVSGLMPNTSYAFQVNTLDAIGNGLGPGNIINITTLEAPDTEAPSAVTDLAASNTTMSTTDLTWTASTDNVAVTDYEVFQDGVSLGLTGGVTSFNVTNLSPSTSYAFTVLASDAAGNSSTISNTANVTTLGDTEAPTAVTDLSASGTTATSTDLSWTASTDNVGVSDYEVFQDGVSIGLTGGLLSFNVTGLSPSTSYAFTVVAQDAAGNVSTMSNTANVTTLAPPDTEAPTAVADLAASNTTMSTTNLTWTASTDNIGVSDYEVFQDGVSIGQTGGLTSFNVTGLSPDTGYAFTVFAQDVAGNVSTVSNTANVTTLTDSESPTAVTDLSASGTTVSSTGLTWTASTDNVGVTNYEVFQDGVSIGLSGGATSFNVTGLTPSTSYAFTVVAQDEAGNVSAVSNTVNITTSGATIYTTDNANLPTIDWQGRDLFANRNVGIGTTDTQGYRLAVAGNIVAEEIKVALQANWPDYVFRSDYNLPTLKEVENHIKNKGHLVNIPSASQVEKNGIVLGNMNVKLLEKIEELTLYVIDLQKQIDYLKKENQRFGELEAKINVLQNIVKTLEESQCENK